MSFDERPTAAQFKAMPRDHKREHTEATDLNGDPFTAESKAEFRALRSTATKADKTKKASRYGKSHTVESSGI